MNANSPEKSRPSGFSDDQMEEEKVRGFWQELAAVFRWIAGKDNVTLFIHKDAENYPRAFCKTCGAPCPRFARDGVRWMVPAGLLETDPPIRPSDNIFWPLHAQWYVDPDGLPKHEARPKPGK